MKLALLTGREMATINAKPTKHEKNETLLALVSKFSSANFEKFLQALEEIKSGTRGFDYDG